jgi:phosphate transport system substrate-binding protein
LRRKKRYLKEQLQSSLMLEPVVEDEITIFQNQYKATILLESRSEKKWCEFLKDTSVLLFCLGNWMKRRVNILSSSILSLKPLKLGLMQSFISNKIIMIHWLRWKMSSCSCKTANHKWFVFDNPNSSTARYMKELV